MRSSVIAILGTPLACWGVLGCLNLLGVPGSTAIVGTVLWGMFWLTVVHVGRSPRFNARYRRDYRGRGSRNGRQLWNSAVASSLFLPLPVYLLSAMFELLHIAPSALTIPIFALLALPAPLSLWWMVVSPAERLWPEEEFAPVGWRNLAAPPAIDPTRSPRTAERRSA
jgi:hypothetical protein